MRAVVASTTPWLLSAAAATVLSAQAQPRIAYHDNRESAGRLENGVLTISLRAAPGVWYPDGEHGPARAVLAFGEDGEALAIPSPLIRAPVGTTVQLSLRNQLDQPLRVHGLCDKPSPCEPLALAPGERREVRFALREPGTYHYWASLSPVGLPERTAEDSQLGGAIVVDAPGATVPDRVLVLGVLGGPQADQEAEVAVINGRSWPLTERLEYAVGDTARWRLLNLSRVAHSMHLHGFYFDIDGVGDGRLQNWYDVGAKRRAVTEQLPPGRTAYLSWVPERAGNWLFHCHMLVHMMHVGRTARVGEHQEAEGAAGMAGMVLGVHTTGGPQAVLVPDAERRRLQLVVSKDTGSDERTGYRVQLKNTELPPPRLNDGGVPGPVLLLTRGEPVAVEVVNRMAEPTAIHWHGIELESYDDGVPGFGGVAGNVTPPVAPGGSFTARFTPDHAGTFIYHTHWHNAEQLARGIYGPLIVLEPGESYHPETDRILVLGLNGPYRGNPDEPFAVNGDSPPRPLELRAGARHRLRFINITADGVALTVQLLSGHDPVRWTLLGKDGAEVGEAARKEQPARQLVAVGETYDFELAPFPPTPIGLWLELRRGNGELVFQWPVIVR